MFPLKNSNILATFVQKCFLLSFNVCFKFCIYAIFMRFKLWWALVDMIARGKLQFAYILHILCEWSCSRGTLEFSWFRSCWTCNSCIFFLNGKDNNKKSREASILFFIYLRMSFLLATSLISYVVNLKIFTFINRLQRVRFKVRKIALLFAEKRAGKNFRKS